ncbi:MAG: hypothetical protein Crog4KO_28480 [Crocinitomicaceae bacterium]
MTSDKLNQLFASAREIPVETAPEQVAGWVGVAAASSTGVLGIASKLKLFIAKKTFLFMGTIISIASLGVIVSMSLNSNELPQEAPVKKQSTAVMSVDAAPEEKQEAIPVAALVKSPPKAAEVPTPISPIEPIAPSVQEEKPVAPIALPSTKRDDRRSKSRTAPTADGEFVVDDFSVLKISGLVDVVLMQGSTPKVTFDINPEIQEDFQLTTEDGVLNIGFDKEAFANKRNAVVYVTFTDLKELRFSGVGDVSSKGEIKLDELLCKISGVGDVALDIDCKKLDVKFSGVGNVKVEGEGESANYAWSGIGNLKASNMKSKVVALSLSGMGDAELHATESLEVNLTGFGDVKYVGSPKTTDLNTPGNGQIKGS